MLWSLTMTSNYLFHGTCLKNAKSILENGFDGNEGEQIWNVSAGYNYFWSLKDVAESEGEQAKYMGDECLNRARDAGETAIVQSNCSHIVVFQVKASMVNYEPDDSCENMAGAVVSRDLIPASAIEKIWVSDDLTYFKPFMLAGTMAWNSYLRNAPEVPESLQAAAQAILDSKVEFYYQEHMELRETHANEILSM